MSNDYEINPFADQFPMLSGRELQELADDIAANGQQEPILLSSDGTTVYDGRNRLAAIALLPGVEPITKRVEVTEEERIVQLIISHNLRRRHLTTSQRAMLGAAGLKELERIAKERERARKRDVAKARPRDGEGNFVRTTPATGRRSGGGRGGHDSEPAKAMASTVGVSPASIDRAKRILREDKDLAAKVQGGQMSIGQARQELRKAKAKEIQPEPAQDPALDLSAWMPPHGKPPAWIRTGPARLARIEWIRVGAAQGLRAEDIAKDLGIRADIVRKMAKEASVEFRVASRTKKPNFDPERLLDLLVDDLGSMASTYIERIETRLTDVDAAKLPEYVAALKERRTPITRLINQLERAIDDLPERTFQ